MDLGPTIFADVAAALPTYGYLVLDLETTDATPDQVEQHFRSRWLPSKSISKPETVGRNYFEALAEKKERAALVNDAPIVCVSLRSEDELRCLHALGAAEPREVDGGLVEGFDTSRDMLRALRNLLDVRCDPSTLLVGHNVLGFDLRKLRWAYVAHGLRMPYVLQGTDQPVFDTMLRYGSLFAVGDKGLFVSLDVLLQEFGIPSHKGEINGAMVPGLVAEGRVDDLVAYALQDVLAEQELFLRMTGQVEDQPAAPARVTA